MNKKHLSSFEREMQDPIIVNNLKKNTKTNLKNVKIAVRKLT